MANQETNQLSAQGTFIQPQPWMQDVPKSVWQEEFAVLGKAHIDMVIVQWLKQNGNKYYGGKFDTFLDELFDYADTHSLKIYLGLWFGDDWWSKAEHVDADYFAIETGTRSSGKLLTENAILLRDIKRYTAHKSFAGWYIPQEPWNQNYSDTELGRLKACFDQLSRSALKIHAGRILISPFFNPQGYPLGTPYVVERIYGKLLKDSPITDLLVQDGVGARSWNSLSDMEANVAPYMRAYKRACIGGRQRFWCNLEIFQKPVTIIDDSNSFVPASIDRVNTQIKVESPIASLNEHNYPRLVFFDFFHYMSPVHSGPTLQARKKLLDSYLRTR